jgi:hypothetical protein
LYSIITAGSALALGSRESPSEGIGGHGPPGGGQSQLGDGRPGPPDAAGENSLGLAVMADLADLAVMADIADSEVLRTREVAAVVMLDLGMTSIQSKKAPAIVT